MKTLGIKSIVAVLLLTVVTSLTVMLSHRVSAADCCSQTELRVKAQWVNGTLMPVVNLPAIEISAPRTEGVMVKGKIHNGEILIESELPEVEIIGSNPNFHDRPINSDLMVDPNLPIVEIQSTLPLKEMKSGRVDNEGQPMAIATLPQIEIRPEMQESSDMQLAMKGSADEKGFSIVTTAKISTFAFRFPPIQWIRLLFQRVSIVLPRSTQ